MSDSFLGGGGGGAGRAGSSGSDPRAGKSRSRSGNSPDSRPGSRSGSAPAKPWDVLESIWAPRKEWCDSKWLYDTEQAEFKRFSSDFARVLELGIDRLITKNDDGGAEDLNNDGMADEVEDVLEVCLLYTSPSPRDS